MRYFVLERNRCDGKVELCSFDSSDEALSRLRERETASGPDTEVVLFMAQDEQTLRLTHGRYFRGALAKAVESLADHGIPAGVL